jgi:hypothetical protein
MMLELLIKATTVAQVPAGNLIRVNESGKAILGVLVQVGTDPFLLAFERADLSKCNMLLPIDPTETAMDYGSNFRFDLGHDADSIAVDTSRFSTDAGTLVLTGGAALMVTRYASKLGAAYVEIASGRIQKEPSWGSCVLIGGWRLFWWPTTDAEPWLLAERKAPVSCP